MTKAVISSTEAIAAGLPLSLQLVGPPVSEALLCRAGHAFQQRTDWHTRRPPEP
jgi:amidase